MSSGIATEVPPLDHVIRNSKQVFPVVYEATLAPTFVAVAVRDHDALVRQSWLNSTTHPAELAGYATPQFALGE